MPLLQISMPSSSLHQSGLLRFFVNAANIKLKLTRRCGRSWTGSRRQLRERFGLTALGLGDGAGAIEDHERALVDRDVDHLAVNVHRRGAPTHAVLEGGHHALG